MEYLTAIWEIFKIVLLVGISGLLAFCLFSILHPLKFQLRTRASIKGQRAEFWFIHLFNSLKLGVIATPHTQDILIRFLYWEKIIQRNTKKQPPVLEKEEPSSTEDIESQISSKPSDDIETIEEEKKPSIEPVEKSQEHAQEETTKSSPATIETTATTEPDASEKAKEEKQPETLPEEQLPTKKDEQIIEDAVVEPITESESEPEVREEAEEAFPKPLDEVKLPEPEESQEPKQEKTKDIPLKEKLRNIKKLVSKRFKEAKKWFRICLKKWEILKPVISRFWNRLKKGFSLEGPDIKCRYALHEPYITGMFQGSLAILSGMLNRFGVNFVPVPEFNDPMIYVKGKTTARIHPWRLMIALLGLAFEKAVWQQLWAAFKFYREHASKLSSAKN
jgi:hypothetical protein